MNECVNEYLKQYVRDVAKQARHAQAASVNPPAPPVPRYIAPPPQAPYLHPFDRKVQEHEYRQEVVDRVSKHVDILFELMSRQCMQRQTDANICRHADIASLGEPCAIENCPLLSERSDC